MDKGLKRCEYCKKSHDGSFGSGRFCSLTCAKKYSSTLHSEAKNRKISSSIKGRDCFAEKYGKGSEEYKEVMRKRTEKFVETWKNKRKGFYYICEGDQLNITNGELEKYRKEHLVCEICGREETADTAKRGRKNKLTVDHNHNSKHFRGLLCQSCNRMLGWYENQYKNIEQYLQLHDPEWRNGKRS